MANCCVAGCVAELLMQGCVVLQGLEQACMDVVCTAVVGGQLLVGGTCRSGILRGASFFVH